ncbi:MAG: zf-HC2 domain-containing protein [Planctomycetes bacterium]|nr:zf-HC2 domain-containing protein [Planctomycetota bacterium]
MINCEQTQHLFDSYLNDELSASLVAEVDAHRLECAACRHQLTLMEACGNVIRLDACEPRPSADFTDRLMAILDEEKPSRRWLGISRGTKIAGGLLGVAAAIAAVVVFYPTAVEKDLVAGAEVPPDMIKSIPAANLISGLPLGLLFDATDNISSSINLGHYSIDHLRTTIDPEDMLPSPYPDFDLPGKLELDIIELLPDLDDGGELL